MILRSQTATLEGDSQKIFNGGDIMHTKKKLTEDKVVNYSFEKLNKRHFYRNAPIEHSDPPTRQQTNICSFVHSPDR